MAYVIAKSRLWRRVAYAPNVAQRKIHAATERNLVVAAGRRLGKSTAGGHELLPEVYRAYLMRNALQEQDKRLEFWGIGPQYSDSEKEFRAFYNACRRLKMPFDKPGTYYDARGGDMQVSLWGGRFLYIAHSAKHPEHLVGEGINGALICEAAKIKERIWVQYVRPTLADYRGWAKFLSTPEGKNWFYNLYMKGIAGEEGWASVKAPSWFNTVVFPLGEKDPEIIQMRRDMSSEMFNQEVGASFSEYVGRVFKDYDEDWHVRRVEYRRDLPLYVATDYGWTNPNVMLFIQVDEFGRVYVLSEYYQTHRSPEEFARDIEEGEQDYRHREFIKHARLLFPDPEDPAASYTLAERLRLVIQGNTGGDLKTRLELIRKWLKDENPDKPHDHPDRRPRLIFDPSCKNTLREMDAYRYPETKLEQRNEAEKPMDKDNHCPEALGRFFRGHFGNRDGGGPVVVRKVQMSRRTRRRTV